MADVAAAARTEDERGDGLRIATGVVAVLFLVLAVALGLQALAERNAVHDPPAAKGLKEQREVDKLTAEIDQIRSDTSGSLFSLKLAAVFVTVGSAMGSYLVAQGRSSRNRLRAERERLGFEQRAQVDAAYQAMVQDLAAESPLLRAAAAMKLGRLIFEPPVEWSLTHERSEELRALTKQILAASLAIEKEDKVQKALTAAVALRQPTENGDLRRIDFSGALAADAYWAAVDFSEADFYRADLRHASLRRAVLESTQFREACLQDAVLADATCLRTSFKLADLRRVDLRGANLSGASFEGAKVGGARLEGATYDALGDDPATVHVDIAAGDDERELVAVGDWLAAAGATPAPRPAPG